MPWFKMVLRGGAHIGFFRMGILYAYRHGNYIYYADEPGVSNAVGGIDLFWDWITNSPGHQLQSDWI